MPPPLAPKKPCVKLHHRRKHQRETSRWPESCANLGWKMIIPALFAASGWAAESFLKVFPQSMARCWRRWAGRGAGDDRHLRFRGRPLAAALWADHRFGAAATSHDGAMASAGGGGNRHGL